jgi:putative nucleotidyltransferase with HDIG domain
MKFILQNWSTKRHDSCTFLFVKKVIKPTGGVKTMQIHVQKTWLKLLLQMSKRIDSYISLSGTHSMQVAHLVMQTTRKFNCPEALVKANYWAALLHDVGKISVPEPVLSKAGPLNEKEWAVMKLHPTVGANIVQALHSLPPIVAPIIYSHQEKYDGTGYPEGLKGEEIPLSSRILGVVDAYDAMTNQRVYSRARSSDEATSELLRLSGRQFDPMVVDKFLMVLAQSNGKWPREYMYGSD